MIVISHDRFFVERTTDKVYALLGDATLRMLPRGIDEYLERRHRMEEVAAAAATPAPVVEKPAVSAADARAAKKELQRIERQLDKLSGREAELHRQIAENATDFGKVPAWTPSCANSSASARAGAALAGLADEA